MNDIEELLKSLKTSNKWARIQRTTSTLISVLAPSSDQMKETSPYAFKFLDCNYWLRANVKRAIALNLHKQRKLRILDIGTGIGFFPYVCRHLGHTVISTEINRLSGESSLIYPAMRAAAGTFKPRTLFIRAPRLRIGRRFDLICAYMVCFGRDWRSKDWSAFLLDSNEALSTNGRLYLRFNRNIFSKTPKAISAFWGS